MVVVFKNSKRKAGLGFDRKMLIWYFQSMGYSIEREVRTLVNKRTPGERFVEVFSNPESRSDI